MMEFTLQPDEFEFFENEQTNFCRLNICNICKPPPPLGPGAGSGSETDLILQRLSKRRSPAFSPTNFPMNCSMTACVSTASDAAAVGLIEPGVPQVSLR